MLTLLTSLTSLILLFSCANEPDKVVEETFDDGEPKLVRYYEENGEDKSLTKEITYYPNGSIRYTGEYNDNKKDGHWEYYYKDGTKWSEGYFKEGERDGKAITYHENGQIYYEGQYTDGIRSGTWRFYDNDGKLIKEVDYED